MAARPRGLTFGFPRLVKEPGERRDFLPALVRGVARTADGVVIDRALGQGLRLTSRDYVDGLEGRIQVAEAHEAWHQDVVVALRYPRADELERMRRGATLVSMVHFATRPRRIAGLEAAALDAVSLDCIADDDGNRLVDYMEGVAWSGLQAAFRALARQRGPLDRPGGPPVSVTVLGTGAVGRHAVDAATKYGDREQARELESLDAPGVEVVAVGRTLAADLGYMRARLASTDVLVDATQRRDPSLPVVPRRWLGWLPPHAVICDLAVDPYVPDGEPPVVRGIEGVPQGDLDELEFPPDHPAWEDVPDPLAYELRRTTVSCYSWPGVHPRACMHVYGRQLAPLLEVLIDRGGTANLRDDGPALERALYRGSLRGWKALPRSLGPAHPLTRSEALLH